MSWNKRNNRRYIVMPYFLLVCWSIFIDIS